MPARIDRSNQLTGLNGAPQLTGIVPVPNLPIATATTLGVSEPGTGLSVTAGAMSATSGGSAINQLTGDVTAGPGTGSQAASVVKVNGAAVPASQAYVGTNGSGQIVTAATPAALPHFVDSETVSGSGTAWTLAHAPAAGCVPILVVQIPAAGGTVLLLGQTPGFTISGANITTTTSYLAGALFAWYRY